MALCPPACGDHVRTAPALTWARRRPPFYHRDVIPIYYNNTKEFTMANYTAANIKALREKTGAGMLDVKKALDEG